MMNEDVRGLIWDLKVNECGIAPFDLDKHEKILFELFNLGIGLFEIGYLKGVI